MKRLGLILSLALLWPVAAMAQAVQQSGAASAFHTLSWLQSGYVVDGGASGSPAVNALGMFEGATCPLGISSQTAPGVSLGPYGLITFCQTTSAATITVAGVNGNANPPLVFNVGGVNGWTLDANAHVESGGSAPSCGTGCASVAGTDSAFDVTGGSSRTTIAVAFAAAWPTGPSLGGGPICAVTAENAAAASGGVVRESTTTAAITLTMSSESAAEYQVRCSE